MKRVAVTGATGMIGSALVRSLRSEQIAVTTIGRGAAADVRWDFQTPFSAASSRALEGLDGVVHLAGAPIGRRWTARARREIVESRVTGTTLLAQSLSDLRERPRALVSGSAVGIYGNRGDATITEESATGDGFLADTARAWEGATRAAEEAGIRTLHIRTGIALDAHGGALERLLLPFRLGVGGRLATGRQWMSWILLADVVRAIRFLLEGELHGAVNVVAPNPATNAEFTRALGAALRRPALLPVPGFALKLLFGEMAERTLLEGQRVVPARLVDAGFEFVAPTLDAALPRAIASR